MSATRQGGVTLVCNQWIGTSGTRGQPVQALNTSCPDVQFIGGKGGGAHTLNLTGHIFHPVALRCCCHLLFTSMWDIWEIHVRHLFIAGIERAKKYLEIFVA